MAINAAVTVSLTIEVRVGERWGEDCTIGQIRLQANEAALLRVGRLLGTDSTVRIINDHTLAIVLRDEK